MDLRHLCDVKAALLPEAARPKVGLGLLGRPGEASPRAEPPAGEAGSLAEERKEGGGLPPPADLRRLARVRVGGGARARVRVRRPVARPQRYESRAADVYAPFG